MSSGIGIEHRTRSLDGRLTIAARKRIGTSLTSDIAPIRLTPWAGDSSQPLQAARLPSSLGASPPRTSPLPFPRTPPAPRLQLLQNERIIGCPKLQGRCRVAGLRRLLQHQSRVGDVARNHQLAPPPPLLGPR